MTPKALGRIIPEHAAPIVIPRLMTEEGITRSQAIFRIWTHKHNVEARQHILRQKHYERRREREQPADWAWREVQEATEDALR